MREARRNIVVHLTVMESDVEQNLRNTVGELPPNVERVATKQGTHFLLYTNHYTSEQPSELLSNCQGVALETGLEEWTESPHLLMEVFRVSQYSEILEMLERERIPVYLTDPHINNIVPYAELSILGIEAGGGTWLLMNFPEKYKRYKERGGGKLTRRDILKLGSRAGVGLYLFSPWIGVAATFGTNVTGICKRSGRIFSHAVLTLHPEVGLLTMHARNAIIAHKQEEIMQREKIRTLATVIGSLHSGLEGEFRTAPEDRLRFLHRIRPLLTHAFSPSESLYQIVKMEFNGEEWKETACYDVPELKELVDESLK